VTGTRNAEKDDLWLGAPEAENGYIELGDAPGFGVIPNDDLV
jgi:L-alanine-DL-glutamate epimerase-like enolase superfamily enzyme